MLLPRPVAALTGLLTVVLLGLTAAAATPSSAEATATSAPGAATTVGAASTLGAATLRPPAPTDATPALRPTGRAADGWLTFALPPGRLPDPARVGEGFRGEIRFRHADRDRAVRLFIPADARRPAPLLVALHGLYQPHATTEREQQWGPLARREGIVLAYGVGTSASWNAGVCCGRAVVEGVDDVGYLDQVVRIAGALHPLDPDRLHLAGFSNGAMMAYRYACERRTAVAGVLAVGGTVAADCRGRSDVAVLHVHGVQDRTVPLAGVRYNPVLATGLRPVAETQTMFGPTVRAALLPRYGHGWPTAARGGYDTTRLGWAFLQAHPRSRR